MSKGRLYDFAGNFRRDRNYFDYNLLDNSLLIDRLGSDAGSGSGAEFAAHLQHGSTEHRHDDDTAACSRVSFRVGYNHNTMKGPTYATYPWRRRRL